MIGVCTFKFGKFRSMDPYMSHTCMDGIAIGPMANLNDNRLLLQQVIPHKAHQNCQMMVLEFMMLRGSILLLVDIRSTSACLISMEVLPKLMSLTLSFFISIDSNIFLCVCSQNSLYT